MPSIVAAPTDEADQLSLLTDEDLERIEASSDETGDKRPRWYSVLATCGWFRTMYHRHGGIVAFVGWNLARMGGYRWHDLSTAQIARELGITERSVKRLMKKATETGELRRARERGHGHRKVTRPGVIVELHPSLLDAKGDRSGHPRVTDPGRKGDRSGHPSVEVLDRDSETRPRRRRSAPKPPPCGASWGEHHARLGACTCEVPS
ncbi:sigma factor-like helix-turn-helix DNA-binding protein [Candidatus Poriferisodalis sp.]|uniref:sigma factor-like helix-turn-helix DNA-binding protein n=1 Tax=Candidatus Poriferisodalis sp. TaxID=3101277 RepID=UPI003B02335E